MNIALWIIAGLLAASFLGSGVMKLTRPRAQLARAGMGWADDLGDGTVKGIGVLEILAAAGLILPAALGITRVLTPLAAIGLVLLMAGAMIVHVRRHELPAVAVNLAFLTLAAVVAVGRV